MSACPFEVVGLERRPYLDPTRIKEAYLSRAAQCHPDRTTGSAEAFVRLQRAYLTLKDPVARLRSLAGEATQAISPPHPELFLKIGRTTNEARSLLSRPTPQTPIALAARATRLHRAGSALHSLVAHVDGLLAACEERIHEWDAQWPEVDHGDLLACASEIQYLKRWKEALSETLFEVKQAASPGNA